MALLTAGFYYRRDWGIVQLLTSSVIGGQTVWQANLYGGDAPMPPGPYGVIGAAQFVETGVPLPQTNVPPVGPLATFFNPGASVPPQISGAQQTDLMWPIGAVGTNIGLRG